MVRTKTSCTVRKQRVQSATDFSVAREFFPPTDKFSDRSGETSPGMSTPALDYTTAIIRSGIDQNKKRCLTRLGKATGGAKSRIKYNNSEEDSSSSDTDDPERAEAPWDSNAAEEARIVNKALELNAIPERTVSDVVGNK